jgi:hypothetical protein
VTIHVPAPRGPGVSPLTGLTRADWERTADQLLAAVRRHAAPGNSLIHLPGPVSGSGRLSDGLEGYARTFMLAAFRAAHPGRELADATLAPYEEGLAVDTNPPRPRNGTGHGPPS